MNQLVTLKRGMISAIMLLCAATGFAQTSVVTITNHVKNNLQAEVTAQNSNYLDVTQLTISGGSLGNADIATLRAMTGNDKEGAATAGKLANLDISNTLFANDGDLSDDHVGGGYYFTTDGITEAMIPGISDSGAGNYTNQRLYTYKAIVKKNAAGQYYIPNQPTIDKVPAFMFYGCTSLKTIKLPNVAVIGFAAFSASGLTELQLPARTIEIHQWALRNCASLTKLDYSLVDANTLVNGGTNGAWGLGYGVAANCKQLENVIFPKNSATGLTAIAGEAFRFCEKLKTISFPGGATVGANELDLSSLTALNYIGGCAFQGTIFNKVILPKSLKSIGDKVFKSCSNLTEIVVNSPKINCYYSYWHTPVSVYNDNYQALGSGENDAYGCIVDQVDWRKCVLSFAGDAVANIDNYRGQPGWKHLLRMTIYSDGNHLDYSDNTVTYKNQQGATITLVRSMTSGQWYSMILPFDLTRSQIENAFGNGTYVALFHHTTPAASNLVMHFNEVYTPNSSSSFTANQVAVPANTPFIINPGTTATQYVIGDDALNSSTNTPDIAGANISNDGTMEYKDVKGYDYIGVYKAIPRLADGTYFIKNNEFYKVRSIDRLRLLPFRAYFKASATSVSHSIAPIFHIDGIGTVTGINDINIDNDSDSQKGDVYTASGVLVRKDATNLEGLPAGVYLKNGKKYIVK